MPENNNHHAADLPATPDHRLRELDRLVGSWRIHGPDVEGINTYRWMEGGFFLVHDFDLVNFGNRFKGIEFVGHDADTDELVVRLIGENGSRFHYVWEIDAEHYNAWFGDRGSDNYSEARFLTPDRIEGAWKWPDENGGTGGYTYLMDRIPVGQEE